MIDWLHVARLYVPYTLTASLVFAVSCLLPPRDVLVAQYASNPRAAQAYAVAFLTQATRHVAALWYAYAIIVACVVYLLTSKPPVYLIDFEVFTPPADWQVSRAEIVKILRNMACYKEESLDFMTKLLNKSGTGEATHWPPGTVKLVRPDVSPALFVPKQAWVTAAGAKDRLSPKAKAAAAASAPAASSVSAGSAPASSSSSARLPSPGAAAADPRTVVASAEAASAHHLAGDSHDAPLAKGPDVTMRAARLVAEQVLCTTFEDLLIRTGVRPAQIDFLIVNCSLFSPTPSLASLVARRFGLRVDVRTYSLGGMGCSASLVSVDLAKQLLENRRNSLAVVLSTEEISQQMYRGNRKDMLLQNTLFRVGGAAVLLSNKLQDGFRAKYKLLHSVRAQDNSDEAETAVVQVQDETGLRGISLSKELVDIAGRALKTNFTLLGPYVLPVREQIRVVWSILRRAAAVRINRAADSLGLGSLPFCGGAGGGGRGAGVAGAGTGAEAAAAAGGGRRAGRLDEKTPIYVPDFKKAVAHFCIHAGGRAVIDGIETNLKLERHHTAPSRATLFHWGNTSSSSIWYELRYVEGENDRWNGSAAASAAPAAAAASSSAASSAAADVGAVPQGWDPERKWALPEYRGRHVRSGERVLQIAFGSGFKCNSAVWLRMK